VTSFAELPAALVRALGSAGIDTPFPIQAATLPDALAGENVLGRARTGAGKTLGFGLPMLARLAGMPAVPKRPVGLVLVPTRELAQQVADALTPLGRALGVRLTTVYGGTSIPRQIRALEDGVHIVVATPGRLVDLLERRSCDLSDVAITVLDEADHMCDLGFLPVVTDLLGQVPAGGQRMLFSATLDGDVNSLVRKFLPEPVLVAIDPEASPITTMTHHAFEVPDREAKLELLAVLAGGAARTLLFVRTKHGADRLARQLGKVGVPASALHGGMQQGARTRSLKAFAEGSRRVLVATDVAARGIHVDEVDLVVHADPPTEPKAYLHRSGRTARAGAEGIVAVVSVPDERAAVAALLAAAGVGGQPIRVTSDDALVVQLVADAAARAASASLLAGPEAEQPQLAPTREERRAHLQPRAPRRSGEGTSERPVRERRREDDRPRAGRTGTDSTKRRPSSEDRPAAGQGERRADRPDRPAANRRTDDRPASARGTAGRTSDGTGREQQRRGTGTWEYRPAGQDRGRAQSRAGQATRTENGRPERATRGAQPRPVRQDGSNRPAPARHGRPRRRDAV
jgi:superfamily II DNA/RNA helicase